VTTTAVRGREDMGRGKDKNKNESADQCRDNTLQKREKR